MERDFERSFQVPDEIGGAVTPLPKLFDSSVISTIFDRVLERAYESDAKAVVLPGSGDVERVLELLLAYE